MPTSDTIPPHQHDSVEAGTGALGDRGTTVPRSPGRPARRRRRANPTTVGLVVVAIVSGVLLARSLTSSTPPPATGSEAELRAWVADHPDDVESWQRLGELALADATATDDLGAYLSAADALATADSLRPDDHDTRVAMAVAAVGLHRFGDAEALAADALADRPDDRLALAALVDATTQQGDYDRALDAAERLVGLRPDTASLSRLSYVRQLTGDTPGAFGAMLAARSAAQGSPAEQARIDLFLAELYRQTGDLDAAEASYLAASASPTEPSRAIVGLAQIDAATGDLTGAIERLEQPGIGNGDLAALMTRVRIDALLDDAEAAERGLGTIRSVVDDSLSIGIGIDPSDALFEADWGDPDRAVELATVVLGSQPGNIHAADAMAWSLHRSGDTTAALPHVERALRTGADDPVLLAHAAIILAAAGETDRSAELLDRALTLDPGLARPYDALPLPR